SLNPDHHRACGVCVLCRAVLHILSVFHPLSAGNFYHACPVLSRVLRTLPEGVHNVLLTKEGSTLFANAFHHLHESSVPGLLIDVLTTPTPNHPHKKQLFIG